jgi:hypothetical protein
MAKMAKMAKNTGPGVIAIFPVHRHGPSRIEALSGILRVVMPLTH